MYINEEEINDLNDDCFININVIYQVVIVRCIEKYIRKNMSIKIISIKLTNE